jgi:hypothetical protein
MFDAPCGDLNWILAVVEQTGVTYKGGDIAKQAIELAKQRAPAADVVRFDITSDDFPHVDIWHCRDCLFHLSFEMIEAAMKRFLASGTPFALITTHRALYLRNKDVVPGGFRYLDLRRDPIGLPAALAYLKDFRLGRDFPRYVALWSREQIAARFGRSP